MIGRWDENGGSDETSHRAASGDSGRSTGLRLHELIEPVVKRSPETVVANTTRSMTVGRVWELARTYADTLMSAGVTSGEPVVVVVSSDPVDVAVVVALSMVEAVACFAPPGGTAEGVREAARRTGARAVVGRPHASMQALDLDEAACFVVDDRDQLSGRPLRPARIDRERPPGLARAHYVNFTSGSTGRPKAVLHTADSMRYAASKSILGSGADDGAVLGLVALSHAAGLAFSVFAALPEGRDLVMLDGRWDARRALSAIARFDAAWTLSVPTHLMDMVAVAAESGWRRSEGSTFVFACGGAAVPAELVRSAQDIGVAACRMYGLSECLGHTGSHRDEPVEVRAAYDGRVFDGTDVVCLTPDFGPLETASGAVQGEAACRGPALFAGYLEEVRGDESLTVEGYFRTGDLVRIDAGDRMTVVGRVKDIIIRGGENVDPSEVEAELLRHPSVLRAAVVGYPDPRLGERVAAWIETGGVPLDREAVASFLLASGVPKFRIPDAVEVIGEIPRNPVGKIDKKLLRHMTQGITT